MYEMYVAYCWVNHLDCDYQGYSMFSCEDVGTGAQVSICSCMSICLQRFLHVSYIQTMAYSRFHSVGKSNVVSV